MIAQTLQSLHNLIENMSGKIGKLSEANSIPPERLSQQEREASYRTPSSSANRSESHSPKRSRRQPSSDDSEMEENDDDDYVDVKGKLPLFTTHQSNNLNILTKVYLPMTRTHTFLTFKIKQGMILMANPYTEIIIKLPLKTQTQWKNNHWLTPQRLTVVHIPSLQGQLPMPQIMSLKIFFSD
jgi:hypothetical protein